MLLLNQKDLAKAFTLPMVIPAVEQAFLDYHRGKLQVSGRLTAEITGSNGSALFLPSLHLGQPYYGQKQASVFPENVDKGLPSTISQH